MLPLSVDGKEEEGEKGGRKKKKKKKKKKKQKQKQKQCFKYLWVEKKIHELSDRLIHNSIAAINARGVPLQQRQRARRALRVTAGRKPHRISTTRTLRFRMTFVQ